MAERQIIRTVPSDAVQGKGSYVKVRSLLYGRSKKIRAELASIETDEEKQAISDKFLVEHIVEWDWVDDEGEPLPCPKDDPTVIDLLTGEEIKFLTNALQGSNEERKKSVTLS